MSATSTAESVEFSGLKGRFFAWFLTSPMRRLLELKMGKPDARILELLALEPTHQVLDAGCGSGFHTLLVAEQLTAGEVVAVDVSREMLDRLEQNARARGLEENITPTLADGLALPLHDASVDRALSAAVWHHLDDPAGACRELVRALRPGGRVVISDIEVKAGQKAVSGLDGHDRAFGVEQMSRILHEAGLIEVTVEQIGTWVLGCGTKP